MKLFELYVDTDHDSYLLFSKVTAIQSLHMTGNRNKPAEEIQSKTQIRNVIAIAADYKQQRVFFSDIQQSNIQSVWINGSSFSNITTVVPCKSYQSFFLFHLKTSTFYYSLQTWQCLFQCQLHLIKSSIKWHSLMGYSFSNIITVVRCFYSFTIGLILKHDQFVPCNLLVIKLSIKRP